MTNALADEYPQAQDSVFGNGEIKDALACSDGVRYYARLTVDGEKAVYRFDSKHGLWMKEDDPGVIGMTYDQGTIYALLEHSIVPEQYENRAIIDLIGNGKIEGIEPTEEAGTVESFAEFGDFTAGSLNRKAMSKIQLRMGLETGATVMWDFHDFPGAFPVEVVEVEQDRKIVLKWVASEGALGDDDAVAKYMTIVTMIFEPLVMVGLS